MHTPISGITKLILVRHAETIWNHEHRYAGHQEVPLGPGAKEQIEQLTEMLVPMQPTVVYASPLTRCLETIFPTAKRLNLSINLELGLRERNLGIWEGCSEAEIRLNYPDFIFPIDGYNGAYEIPDSESLAQLEIRIHAVLQRIAERHHGETILVATHAGVIWSIITRLVDNVPPEPKWPGNTIAIELYYDDAIFHLHSEV
jgi:broad specificity phosphatase PhoE